VTPDPKWLEILKASGWQTTALAVAFGCFLLLLHFGVLNPPQEPVVTALATLAFLICACLAIASIAHAAANLFQPRAHFIDWTNRRRQRHYVRNYIPHMTTQEKQIIAYLLAKNQKTITADQDGGYASTLIPRGILVLAVRRGQAFRASDTPFAVPDHIWNELTKHKEQFPYTPVKRGDMEPYPWRVPWMAR
jgi:hypothetical protein